MSTFYENWEMAAGTMIDTQKKLNEWMQLPYDIPIECSKCTGAAVRTC